MRIFMLLCAIILSYVVLGQQKISIDKIVNNFDALVNTLPQEKLYLHTDKSMYIAGETIWFRAYGVNALTNLPGIPSRFLYVDLVNNRDSLVDRVKLVVRDSCFYGQLTLSKNIPQGEYGLRAYTYNMLDEDECWVFRKRIHVINPLDSKVKTVVTYIKEKGNYYAVVRFLSEDKKPLVQVPVVYTLNPKGYGFPETRIGTDRNGEVRIKLDTTDRILRLASYENESIPFERYIRLPDLREDFDVQFFPEGGNLLTGNRQQVAFKAIGSDGFPIDVKGEVYQDSIFLFAIQSEHDGMGSFWLPVNAGARFRVRVLISDNREKWIELPESVDDCWGVKVDKKGGNVEYQVMKGESAVADGGLLVLVHSRGVIFDFRKVRGLFKGKIAENLLPEGITQIVLMDSMGHVYSQRQFFVKKRDMVNVSVTGNKEIYNPREQVELKIGFDETYVNTVGGTFSLSVTDDEKVEQNMMEDNIVSNLLLTSYLKGYVHEPAYYFSDTTLSVEHHLDLVMQTHGWTRFETGKIIRGEFPKRKYEIEVGQLISGQVKSLVGKESQNAQIALLSNYGAVRVTETDSAGYFVVDDLLFDDSTSFLVQALNYKGRKNVEVSVNKERFLAPEYFFPDALKLKQQDDTLFEKFSRNYYYENGIKVHVLDEVNVLRRQKRTNGSFYDISSRYRVDSVELSRLPDVDILQLAQLQFAGVTVGTDSVGNPCPLYHGKPMYVLVNDMEEDMVFIKMIPKKEIWGMSVLDPMQGQAFFGARGSNGVLLITKNPNYISVKHQNFNIKPFRLLGYQIPDEFYVPRYDIDSVRLNGQYDERTTIYWNPVIKIESGEKATVRFYTADTPGTYTLTLEGITLDGKICRKKWTLLLK